jgi:hypothetical protein
MGYFYPSGGMKLSDLKAIVPSAALPWPSVAMADEGRAPRTYSYSLTVQRKLPGATLLEAAFVSNISRFLPGWPDINPVPEGAELGVDWPGNDANFDAPYRKYKNIAGIYPAAHVLNSNYSSLQVTVSRTTGAINYWASYTFGKALEYNSANSFDRSRTYGPLPWDRTQDLKFSYNINLPAFSKKYLGNHRFLNGVLDGR